MHIIFMNSKNSNLFEPHKLLFNLADKIDLNKNNKSQISRPAWNEMFELRDASYSVSDIQVYFEYIKKH